MAPTRPSLTVSRAPTRRGRASAPLRHLLRQLISPMMISFIDAYDELAGMLAETRAAQERLSERVADAHRSYQQLSERVDETHRRLDRLTDEIAAANALAWDQVALARRLAELEDRLASPPVG